MSTLLPILIDRVMTMLELANASVGFNVIATANTRDAFGCSRCLRTIAALIISGAIAIGISGSRNAIAHN